MRETGIIKYKQKKCMRKCLFLFFLLRLSTGFAQFSADFEEGNLTGWLENMPGRWTADSAEAISGRFSLHHNYDNPESGSDAVSHFLPDFVPDSGEMTFSCQIRHGYAPSSSNRWGWFLYADNSAVSMLPGGKVNGYMVGVNFTGNDDCLHLYKLRNGTCLDIFNTGFNWEKFIGTAKSPRIEVKRSVDGFWDIYVDTTGGSGASLSLGGTFDAEFLNAWHTGFCFVYTATKDRLFWADDLQITGRIITDTVPPSVAGYRIVSSREVRVQFSENLVSTDSMSALFEYRGQVVKARVSACPASDAVILSFEEELPDGDTVEIRMENVTDRAGNKSRAVIIARYHHFRRFDVLITEIMADPSPPIELPDYEYIELYNASPYSADLTGWKIETGSTSYDLSGYRLDSGTYLLLTHKNAAHLFGDSIQVAPVFSSATVLTNTGTRIVLRNAAGEWIDAVEYSDRWYQDSYKKDGGWSLEIMDIRNPCAGISNWTASKSPYGGTPGYRNSVSAWNPDREAPVPLYAFITDSQHIELVFSEPVDSASASAPKQYSASSQMAFPLKVFQAWPKSAAASLFFDKPVQAGTIYELRVSRNVCDCAGNRALLDRSVRFAMATDPSAGDIIINEIMYHPDDSSTEYVELYNNSSRPFDLSKLYLAIYLRGTEEIQSKKVVFSSPRLIFPDDYLVLCRDCRKLASAYQLPFPWSCVEMESLPVLNDEGGRMALLDAGMEVIDAVSWSDDMQFALLHNPKGVALERVHPSAPPDDPLSWHSASSLEGYATPGRRNSQYTEPLKGGERISVSPEVFSPDNDGINDLLEISFTDEHPGWVIDARIFDLSGRLVRHLADGRLAGTFSRIFWDGTSDSGNVCYNGIYILLIRRWDMQGRREEYKKACVLYIPGRK